MDAVEDVFASWIQAVTVMFEVGNPEYGAPVEPRTGKLRVKHLKYTELAEPQHYAALVTEHRKS